jgi:hypothetical protein
MLLLTNSHQNGAYGPYHDRVCCAMNKLAYKLLAFPHAPNQRYKVQLLISREASSKDLLLSFECGNQAWRGPCFLSATVRLTNLNTYFEARHETF